MASFRLLQTIRISPKLASACQNVSRFWVRNCAAQVGPPNLTPVNAGTTQNHGVRRGFENSFAFNILQKQAQDDYINTSRSPILKKLDTDPALLSKENVEQLVEDLKTEIKSCLDTELLGLLDLLPKYLDTEVFDKMWKIIDLEGAERVRFAVPGVVLSGAIKIYQLNLFYRSEWVWSCLKRFCRRLDLISTEEMLQVMFLVNVTRRFPPMYSGFDIQFNLVDHFDNLTLDQMALVSIAFFKSQTKLNNEVIMSKLLSKFMEEAKNCHSLSLAMLSKVIRYSLPLSLADKLFVLQTQLAEEVPRMDPRCLTHVALASTNVLICNEPLIRAIIARLMEILPDVRLKDMERILLIMSLYNMEDKELVERVISEVEKRDDEIAQYPKAFVCLVNYLNLLQNFHFDFIDRVLSKRFIKETYNHSFKKIGGELIYIDKSVEIERPDYKGNRLDAPMVKSSAKVMSFTSQPKIPTSTQQFSYELQDVLQQLYGAENLSYCSILPQFYFPDFVLGFTPELRPIGVTEEWKVHRWGELKHAPDHNNLWLAIIVGGFNTFVRNTGKPLGSMNAKIRQLKILGFQPILTYHLEWRACTNKPEYVRNLVQPELTRHRAQRSTTSN